VWWGLGGSRRHRGAVETNVAGTKTFVVGELTGTELASAVASSDACVVPSRTETLGVVLLEAMAAGCPVVAARSGGIPDIVTDGVNGYLFEPSSVDVGAIDATLRLLEEKQEREVIRQNAREEAERWGWSAATRQLQTFYEGVVYSQVPKVA